ncbi:MAG: DUF1987 domain-containing protein [Bacteroidales bacterium]|nr:DUF1987 domain-containing protein [Bacteroidales bacterium]
MKQPEKFTAEATRTTPWVVLDAGRIIILGRSIPGNPGDFYRPLYDKINSIVNSSSSTKIELGFEYINTSSTKWIYSIIKKLSKLKNIAEKVRIIWYYEQGDEEMCDLGNIFREMIDCPFLLVEVDGLNSENYNSFTHTLD